jgi:hypothetical protein
MTEQYVATESIPVEEIKPCKYCKAPLAWLVSKKTGGKYPVECPDYDPMQAEPETTVIRNAFHKCAARDEALANNG